MKLIQKWKRRKPGIYLVRTDKHIGRGRHNGYVGLSNAWETRRLCHLGECKRHNCEPKPWTDLKPRWHVLRLPWWLGFRWTLALLEAIAITVLLPVYNDKLNRKNPRRVSIRSQRLQRAARDRYRVAGYGRAAGLYRAARYHVLRPIYAVSLIVIALASWWFTE